MKTMLMGVLCVMCLAGILVLVGCENQAQTGALVGGGLGAGGGAIIDHRHPAQGAVIGGVVGGLAGYIIGNEQDKARAAAYVPPPVVVQPPPQPVVVQQPPPAVYVEQRPYAPGPGYVWVDVYWAWNGYQYVWQRGYWAAPPEPTVIWVQPRYEHYDRGYRYTPGYWRR